MRQVRLDLFCVMLFLFFQLLLSQAVGRSTNFKNRDEELILIFNQPKYAPGDTAYFNGFMPKGYNTTSKSHVVSIKLIGRNNEVVSYERFLFLDGIVTGQIIIPPFVVPDVYKLTLFIETGYRAGFPTLYVGDMVISGKNLLKAEGITVNSLKTDSSMVRIFTRNDTCSTRSKVSIQITEGSSLRKDTPTLLTISVYSEGLFRDKQSQSSLLLTLQPYSHVSTDQKVNYQQNVNSINNEFPYYFRGRAVVKSTGKAVPVQSKITFYLCESDLAYEIYTGTDGHFTFPLFRNFESEEVYYRLSYKGVILEDCQILLSNVQLNTNTETHAVGDSIDEYGMYSFQRAIIRKSYDYFVTKSGEKESERLFDNDVESDYEILLDKFEPFSSMAELLMNVVPMVGYKKSGDKERVRIFLKKIAMYGSRDPLYIVNGKMTDNTQWVLGLNPRLVQKIEVLRSEEYLRHFGDLGSDGILVIETTDPVKIDDENNYLQIKGINKTLKFNYLKRSDLKSRVPDLRSSLYWNPSVTLDGSFTFDFYTSDDVGNYIIQIVGIQNGVPFLSKSKVYVSSTK